VPELILTRRAELDLDTLPELYRRPVEATLESLIVDLWTVGKPLVGRMRGLWVARVGNYRVCYAIEQGPGRSCVIVQ